MSLHEQRGLQMYIQDEVATSDGVEAAKLAVVCLKEGNTKNTGKQKTTNQKQTNIEIQSGPCWCRSDQLCIVVWQRRT